MRDIIDRVLVMDKDKEIRQGETEREEKVRERDIKREKKVEG